jgi:hypothetical protein
MVSLSEMLGQAEMEFGRKLNGDEITIITRAHNAGMTLDQMLDAINSVEMQPDPEPQPPKTFQYEAAGKDVQDIGVTDG